MLLQNNIPCDNSSILFNIDAPVVVKPDIVSKKASVKFGILPLIQKGNNPMIEKIIHVKVTITDPSLLPIESEWFLPISKAIPANRKLIADAIKK